ncbi:MAG: hypothetical protein [Thorarchaeia virus VerdaV2]|uniref:Uncharacterized protein n=1 Tax=Thorarchaeia virus VerdaV2 TaxID=3070171 RepID=A0AA35CRB7_9CAUD|nr:MAG: hypothetical protein QIT42_gp32 [Thorarchaeia virus VerdaV2]BDI54926.1 MAG: hypothetical protein [Thorarchaeia virus VerdaV2]
MENLEIEKDWTREYFKARGFKLAEIISKNKKTSFYLVRKKIPNRKN